MKCIKCDCEQDKWDDITKFVEVTMNLTSTESKWGYIILRDKDNSTNIGTFNLDGTFWMWDKKDNYIINQYKNKKNNVGYFKVYRRKVLNNGWTKE